MTTAARDELDALFHPPRTSSPSNHHHHPHDDSSASSTHSLDDDEDDINNNTSPRILRPRADSDAEPEAADSMRVRYFLPRKQIEANTGPKGVIADAHAFETARKAARSRTFIPAALNRASFSPAPPRGDVAAAAAASSEDDDDDDDEFLRLWRDARLKEIQRSCESSRLGGKLGGRGNSPSGRRWGTVESVDAEGYLDAVEKSPRGVTVVVLIYDDASDVSNAIDKLVLTLARVHASTRFVRLHYDEAEFEPAGVPALLAYRDGDKFAGLVPLVDELPSHADVSASALESVLERHQIL